jgi:hypothetical protein
MVTLVIMVTMVILRRSGFSMQEQLAQTWIGRDRVRAPTASTHPFTRTREQSSTYSSQQTAGVRQRATDSGHQTVGMPSDRGS